MLRCVAASPLCAARPRARLAQGRPSPRPYTLRRAPKLVRTLCSAIGSAETATDAETKSDDFISMFERASTPLGTIQRAEAALAATAAMMQALGVVVNTPPEPPAADPLDGPPPTRMPAPANAAVVPAPPSYRDEIVTLDSVLGDGGGSSMGGGGGRGGAGSAPMGYSGSRSTTKDAPKKAAPGPSFWEWTPPEQTPQEPTPGLQLQMKPQVMSNAKLSVDLPFAERELPKFQSEVELPELQSVVEAPSWQDALSALLMAPAPPEQTAEGAEAADMVGTVDISGMAERLRAAVAQFGDSERSGVTADGARWWLESGKEELENGKLCRWRTFRGVSADGSTEWEEKTWETSDAFSYKEIGAEKSGRDSTGRVWREAHAEHFDMDAAGVRRIWRSADKWAKATDGSQWHEKWNEEYGMDGYTERDAYKYGSLAPGVIPEDGHAARWCETWGEKWDGKGAASKWADKWGERDQREGGGQYRKWGDKWTQQFQNGTGHRWGETWNDDPDTRGWYSRKWGEDHNGNRQVRKWGHATDGEQWDTMAEEDTWYEVVPNFNWADAYRHSPPLMQVKARLLTPVQLAGSGDEALPGGESGENVMKPLSLRNRKPKK